LSEKRNYNYFFIKGKPTRTYLLHNGKTIDANIILEEIKYPDSPRWFSVFIIDTPGNILRNTYDGIYTERAWEQIPKEAIYLGSNKKYKEIGIGFLPQQK
jgi:hypothetical protein